MIALILCLGKVLELRSVEGHRATFGVVEL